MFQPFNAKTVIVTGASMGIGLAIARAFCAAGATVVAAARSEQALREAADQAASLPGRLLPFPTDVTAEMDVQRLVDCALEQTGRIDILVDNAGMGVNGSVAEVDLDQWRQTLELNLITPVMLIQKVVPLMRRQGGGQIIQISSVAGRVSVPWIGAYSATKFGLNAISDALRLEETPSGIQVISVYPGSTESNFRDNALGERRWAKVRPSRVSAERVAHRVLRASLRGERDVYITLVDRFICWFGERFPRLSDFAMRKAFKLT